MSRICQETVKIPSFVLGPVLDLEVLRLLVGKGLLSPEWEERILSWRHAGFNVHSRVRARTKTEAEGIGKYMVRPVLALDRLSFLEREGRVGYRHGDDGAELDRIIRHLELTFVAEKPPPVHVFELVALTAAEERGEYE